MKYSVVWASKTGNTALLAKEVLDALPGEDCVYSGVPSNEALTATRVYVGFWTDKGTCSEDIAAFLETLGNQEVFLFGTAGFGGSQEYFDRILARVAEHIPVSGKLVGSYMCQGKMPQSVRARYEAMRADADDPARFDAMIENFDRALEHPNAKDLASLREAILLA